jgi:hypothetical protein
VIHHQPREVPITATRRGGCSQISVMNCCSINKQSQCLRYRCQLGDWCYEVYILVSLALRIIIFQDWNHIIRAGKQFYSGHFWVGIYFWCIGGNCVRNKRLCNMCIVNGIPLQSTKNLGFWYLFIRNIYVNGDFFKVYDLVIYFGTKWRTGGTTVITSLRTIRHRQFCQQIVASPCTQSGSVPPTTHITRTPKTRPNL